MMYEKVRKIRTPLRTEESIFLQKNKNIKTLKPVLKFETSLYIQGDAKK